MPPDPEATAAAETPPPTGSPRPVRVAALVKQIPAFEQMRLSPEGRLVRDGLPLEMSAYCRRAVAQGVALAAQTGGSCTVLTMGPPSAVDVLREALAFGADDGVLITDPALAGSDTLATARALAAALARTGPFDLVLVGRNSVDADTGQVGPELAELLDLPFATGVKRFELVGGTAVVELEHDDAAVDAHVDLPAVLSCAERLIDPCKIKDPAAWAGVDPARVRVLGVGELGPGPWGQEGSPTWVGELRTEVIARDGRVLDGDLDAAVDEVVELLGERGLVHPPPDRRATAEPLPPTGGDGPAVAVLVEPDRARLTGELLGLAARLAAAIGGRTVALGPADAVADVSALGAAGADAVVALDGAEVEEDVASGATVWVRGAQPWAVLAPSTAWGREVAARVAAATGSGLTGDAVGFAVRDGRLLAWKPAFGGSLVAAVTASSPVQLATVRAGVLPPYAQRPAPQVRTARLAVTPRRRVRVLGRRRLDTFDDLLGADVVVGVGQGVDPARYGELDELRDVLGAELAASRKVTDQGWLPRARQVGITGHSLSPRLYVAIGTSGKFNHAVGFRSAGTVVAIDRDPSAPLFDVADVGIVGAWDEVVPRLVAALRRARSQAADPVDVPPDTTS